MTIYRMLMNLNRREINELITYLYKHYVKALVKISGDKKFKPIDRLWLYAEVEESVIQILERMGIWFRDTGKG